MSDGGQAGCLPDLPQVEEQRQQGPADQGGGRGGGDGFGVGVRHERKDTVAGEFLVGAGFSRESRFALAPESPTVPALLLRSGRRWREAPDEGANAASCFCFPPPAIRPNQTQRIHTSARPPPTFGTIPTKQQKGLDSHPCNLATCIRFTPPPTLRQSQKQRFAAPARPHPPFGHLLP